MRCFGCQREFEIGDQYIEDTASGFLDQEGGGAVDGLIADLFGGRNGKIVLCEDCTQKGDGKYLFETVYGDESP